MKRVICLAVVVAAAAFVPSMTRLASQLVFAQGDQHAYFDALVRRGDHYRSYSLRDAAQVNYRNQGGLIDANVSGGLWVTYNPGADTDRNRQDAAKIVIPSFRPWTTILTSISSSDTFIALPQPFSRSPYNPLRVLKIDNEIMTITDSNTTGIFVTRGTYSTARASHAADAPLKLSNNSLISMGRLPLDTTDGHTYFFTWDAYWTDSYLRSGLDGHKTFQFTSGGRNGAIWLEPQTDFGNTAARAPCFDPARHIAGFSTRGYNRTPAGGTSWSQTDGDTVGPGTSAVEPLGPTVGGFCIKPNTWTRFFYTITQRANDYDLVSGWVADETAEPVQIYRDLKVSVRNTGDLGSTIVEFWLEYNTSTDNHLRLDNRDLVAYFRNFVALRDVGDVRPLLLKPLPGLAPAPGPAAPSNVRVLRSS